MTTEFNDFTLNLNLDDVRAWDGKITMIPEGTYVWEVQNAAQTETKQSGNPAVKFTFEVVDDSPENGKTLIKTYPLNADSKALGRFKALMEAIGVNPNEVTGAALLRKRFIADVVHGKMKGGTDATGAPVEGKPTMDLRGERKLEPEEQPAPPPTAATRKEVATVKGNGQAAARR